MLELVRSTIEVSLDGKVHNMRMPTYKEGILYRCELEKVKDDDLKSSDMLIDYLAKLGLPKDVSEGLEIDHLTQVLDFILGAKKK